MSYRLYVQPQWPTETPEGELPERVFHWALLDAGGEIQARGQGDRRETIEQTLSQNALENVNMVGVVPGDEVLFCVADIPAKQARYIRQALPFAVEEQLAQDVDSMHLALGENSERGYQVAAIDRHAMTNWQALFRGWAHTRLTAIYADAALLPVEDEGGWTICLDGDRAMVANNNGEWLRIHAANLAMFIQTLALPREDEVISEVAVTLYGSPADLEQHQALEGAVASQGAISLRQEVLEISPIELLAHAHIRHRCRPINLCEGAFSLNGGSSGALKPWRPLIAVACTWFVLQVGLEVGLGIYKQQQADQLQDQAMAVYRDAFPQDRRTTANNVRRVIQGQLRQRDSQGQALDFLALVKHAGHQYATLPGRRSVSFSAMNYTESRGELVVDLRADSFDKLNALRSGLVQRGLEADIGSVVNEASGARGRLTISGG